MRTSKFRDSLWQLLASYTKNEQRGILILLAIIVLLITFNWVYPYLWKKKSFDHSDFDSQINAFILAREQLEDSIRLDRLQSKGMLDSIQASKLITPFAFNPNGLPEEQWELLGLTDKQIKTIKNYESKGGKFRRKSDLQKMYCISSWEYQILEDFIQIESKHPVDDSKNLFPEATVVQMVNINAIEAEGLSASLKLPEWLAERTIKYRKLLGGFFSKEQLLEVYNFDSSSFERIKNYINIDSHLIKQMDINSASLKELNRHPYISYELSQFIVSSRNLSGRFVSVDEMLRRIQLDTNEAQRIKPYLVAKP